MHKLSFYACWNFIHMTIITTHIEINVFAAKISSINFIRLWIFGKREIRPTQNQNKNDAHFHQIFFYCFKLFDERDDIEFNRCLLALCSKISSRLNELKPEVMECFHSMRLLFQQKFSKWTREKNHFKNNFKSGGWTLSFFISIWMFVSEFSVLFYVNLLFITFCPHKLYL